MHMIFRSTSTWELYHEAIITNRQQPSQRNLRIVSIGIIKIVVAFRMRIRKANQKKIGSANCAKRGVNLS